MCLAVSLAIFASTAEAATNLSFLRLIRNKNLGVSGHQLLVTGNREAVLTAPDGTIFNDGNTSVAGLTIDQVAARFVGTWTIADTYRIPTGSPPEMHSFSLAASYLSPFPDFPTLAYPQDGAIVPPVFEVSPGELGTSVVITGPVKSVKPLPGDGGQITVEFPPGIQQQQIGLLARRSNEQTLGYASPQQSNPTNVFQVHLWRQSESSYSVTSIIPEPSPIVLSGLGLLALAALRRRK